MKQKLLLQARAQGTIELDSSDSSGDEDKDEQPSKPAATSQQAITVADKGTVKTENDYSDLGAQSTSMAIGAQSLSGEVDSIFGHFLCRNHLGSAKRDSSRALSYLPLWNPKDSIGGFRECRFSHSGLGAVQYCLFLCSRLPFTTGKASGIAVRICPAQDRLRSVPVKVHRL